MNPRTRNMRQTRDRRRGMALISVLWITAVLSVLVFTFARSMTTQVRIAANGLDQTVALELAKSGIVRAIVEINNDDTDDWDDEEDSWFGDEDTFKEVALGAGTYTLIRDNAGLVKPDAGDEIALGIADEGGKLDVNNATLEMIAALPVLRDHDPEQIASAIIDWRDEDDEPTQDGAESLHYQALTPPYMCKNAPFETLEELLLVRGITREILYGEDTNRNGVLDANENDGDDSPPSDDSDGELDRGLIDYVTVYSPKAESSDSSSQQTPAGQPASAQQSNLLVNVYTASKDVLMTLPGMDEGLATKIVESRGATSADKSNTEWVSELVGSDVYSQIQRYLTTKSDVFVVDSVGRVSGKPVFRRIRAVIDRRNGSARVIYWRDITSLGPPFRFEEDDSARSN